jgi:hypothetical protein
MIEPQPLLPKASITFNKPPKSSIKSVKFKQLKSFKTFLEVHVDLLGHNFNQAAQQDFGRPQLGIEREESSLAVSIESNRLVPNIVYLRDTIILNKLDKSIG